MGTDKSHETQQFRVVECTDYGKWTVHVVNALDLVKSTAFNSHLRIIL